MKPSLTVGRGVRRSPTGVVSGCGGPVGLAWGTPSGLGCCSFGRGSRGSDACGFPLRACARVSVSSGSFRHHRPMVADGSSDRRSAHSTRLRTSVRDDLSGCGLARSGCWFPRVCAVPVAGVREVGSEQERGSADGRSRSIAHPPANDGRGALCIRPVLCRASTPNPMSTTRGIPGCCRRARAGLSFQMLRASESRTVPIELSSTLTGICANRSPPGAGCCR